MGIVMMQVFGMHLAQGCNLLFGAQGERSLTVKTTQIHLGLLIFDALSIADFNEF
jgi:hypothetical protein